MRIMVLSFLALILLCTAILICPACYTSNELPPLIDILFLSTSAVCITGLTTIDVATELTKFGQLVVLFFIQVGGLGMVIFSSSLLLLFGGQLGLSQRKMLQDYLPGIDMANIVQVTRYILVIFFTIEFIGASILSTVLIPDMGWKEGIYQSIFHSVTSICNAGISSMPNGLMNYRCNLVVNITVMAMVTLGGLGYVVIHEISKWIFKKGRIVSKHNLHIRLVLISSILLTAIGAVVILLFEIHNPEVAYGRAWYEALTIALFQSVTCRSCGFNTADISSFEPYTKQFMMALMFIGGATGSTASGIKVTTFSLLIIATWTHIRGHRDLELYGRRIPWNRVNHATSLTIISFSTVIVAIVLLCYLEPQIDYADVVFDAVSALGTVGLSTGVPSQCGPIAKLLFCVCMFLGRLGPFTVALSLMTTPKYQHTTLPEGNILIG